MIELESLWLTIWSGMTVVSLPVTRPAGRTLLVANPGCRTEPLERLARMGFQCGQADEPYAATAELARRPAGYQSVVLSLQSIFREELPIIATIKKRWPHLDVWLTHTDGRAAATADAIRLGADGLLTDEGLQRTALGGDAARNGERAAKQNATPEPPKLLPVPPPLEFSPEEASAETVLSADELRALLQEPPTPLPRESD
jgi:hypothetical protein